jgi:hypothetical protein
MRRGLVAAARKQVPVLEARATVGTAGHNILTSHGFSLFGVGSNQRVAKREEAMVLAGVENHCRSLY